MSKITSVELWIINSLDVDPMDEMKTWYLESDKFSFAPIKTDDVIDSIIHNDDYSIAYRLYAIMISYVDADGQKRFKLAERDHTVVTKVNNALRSYETKIMDDVSEYIMG